MVRYYTDLIKSNKQWVFAGVFADKAITGTKTDKREEFQLHQRGWTGLLP